MASLFVKRDAQTPLINKLMSDRTAAIAVDDMDEVARLDSLLDFADVAVRDHADGTSTWSFRN